MVLIAKVLDGGRRKTYGAPTALSFRQCAIFNQSVADPCVLALVDFPAGLLAESLTQPAIANATAVGGYEVEKNLAEATVV